MSYVGIILYKNAIIGFGDSKATRIIDRRPKEDSMRGKVDKVFAIDRYMVATFGHNGFFSETGDTVKIELWLRENIGEYKDPLSLMEYLSETISRTDKNKGVEISFCVGGSDIKGLYARHCFVSFGRVIVENKIRYDAWHPVVITGGDTYYCNNIETESLRYAIKDIELDDLEGFLKNYISDKIATVHEEICYNPVGGPVDVKIITNL